MYDVFNKRSLVCYCSYSKRMNDIIQFNLRTVRGSINSESRRAFEGKKAGTPKGKGLWPELLGESGGILPWKILKT